MSHIWSSSVASSFLVPCCAYHLYTHSFLITFDSVIWEKCYEASTCDSWQTLMDKLNMGPSLEELNPIDKEFSLSTDWISLFTIQKQKKKNQVLFQDLIQDSTLRWLVELLGRLWSAIVPRSLSFMILTLWSVLTSYFIEFLPLFLSNVFSWLNLSFDYHKHHGVSFSVHYVMVIWWCCVLITRDVSPTHLAKVVSAKALHRSYYSSLCDLKIPWKQFFETMNKLFILKLSPRNINILNRSCLQQLLLWCLLNVILYIPHSFYIY